MREWIDCEVGGKLFSDVFYTKCSLPDARRANILLRSTIDGRVEGYSTVNARLCAVFQILKSTTHSPEVL